MRWRKRIKNTAIYLGVRLFLAVFSKMPLGLRERFGAVLGALAFYTAPGERQRTLENLRRAYGEGLSEKERSRLAVGVFMNLGRSVMETLEGWKNPERMLSFVGSVKGWNTFEKAYARGKGVLIVTAHLGNWELLAAYFAARVPTAVVAKKTYDGRLDRLLTAFRRSYGAQVIHRGDTRGMLRALKEKKIIGFLMDQDTTGEGVFVPFFDLPAWTLIGPAALAYRTGAPLLTAFCARGKNDRWDIWIDPEIALSKVGEKEQMIFETVRTYTRNIEAAVRRFPDQWMWMHPRWKTQQNTRGSHAD